MTTIPEALSTTQDRGAITKEDVLRLIPKFRVNRGDHLFYQPYLDREYVLGAIGDRGGGKSASSAVIGLVDFLLRGKPVWSNMRIACDILIEDEEARIFGLKSGGVAHFESTPLVKGELLELDETYRNGALVIEEINVQYSNVRRFMTNTNVDFNEVCQQLRKFKTTLIYNVIDEMFIDSQLRALTDMFIRTYDTAFDMDAMARKKKPGLDFCWRVHAMSGYMKGEQGKFAISKKVDKYYFKFAPWRGVYDSGQHQQKGKYSLNKKEKEAEMKAELTIESSEEMMNQISEWRWLEEIALDIKRDCINRGIDVLEPWQLTQKVGRPLTRSIKEALKMYGIRYDPIIQSYKINTQDMDFTQTVAPAPQH